MFFDGSVLSGGADAAEFRHVGGLNAAFRDGHVSRVVERDWAEQWGEEEQ